jgi:hypothetical protein
LKKKGGFNVTDPATQLKSALDAVKTRLKNRQRDLELALATGQKIPGKKGGITYDEETKALQSQVANLQKQYDAINPKQPMTEEERQRISLKAYKTRTATRIADLQDRLARSDFEVQSKRPPVRLDAEAQKLQAQANTIKEQFDQGVMRNRMANRTSFEKMSDTFVKWRRAFVLSHLTVIAKLTSAAVMRMVSTPIEEIIGTGLSKVPGLSEISKRAAIEGGGFDAEIEATSLKDGFMKGLADSAKILRTGKSDLDRLYGRKDVMPRTAIEFLGSIHSALKAPTKRIGFERAMQKQFAWGIRNGVDVTDPLIQKQIAMRAYQYAERQIFMQDNRVASAFRASVNRLQQPAKGETHPPLATKAAAAALQISLPVVKVPLNIAGEIFDYTFGTLTGSARAARALSNGVSELPPEKADVIMRQLKKGSLGGALMATGWMLYKQIGGYYQQGEKTKAGDLDAGEIRAGGVTLPKYLFHSAIAGPLMIGATAHRAAERVVHGRPQGIGEGILAGVAGPIQQVPFVWAAENDLKLVTPPYGVHAGREVSDIAVPGVVQDVAGAMDSSGGQTVRRTPQDFTQALMLDIPGLRQDVPKSGTRRPRVH